MSFWLHINFGFSKTRKRAIFIPTPGQFEQLYLAKTLSDKQIIPSYFQDKFTQQDLKWNDTFSGFKARNIEVDFEELFSLF